MQKLLETLTPLGAENDSDELSDLARLYQKTAEIKQQKQLPSLNSWLRVQALNVTRHAAPEPFRHDEFGTDSASPSDAHIDAVNELISSLRSQLMEISKQVGTSAETAMRSPDTKHLQHLMICQDRAQDWVRAIEQIWDFYFELFGQRQSKFGNWLLGCDRIALDCYQDIYMGLGIAKSIPAPAPFSYMRTGFSPATFRRGIPLSKLGQQINPFPLIQLPYHRLVNPWTLGAILHEVSHNLPTDLNLREVIPRAIAQRLLKAGMSRTVAATWTNWHSETFADMCGLLLGGAGIVASLMDIAARSPQSTLYFHSGAPHPIPYLRVFISIELLRRMGFPETAERYRQIWQRLYPNPRAGNIPAELLKTFSEANHLVVDTICFTKYPQLGDKTLAEVTGFKPQHQRMIEEAGKRLAAGNDPGIIPERFLIPASRWALDQKLAEPGAITQNFYQALGRR
ncbi:hypothetical protein [Microseira wollei]|uniref:Uncharacterized protein n=1 Tax=Microseira wollei NIES-4236 TaxID=2530354 RepID=A0AAV3XU38_9CYAN|nr:hypothetical protein [Microseira wollei]GET44545.1 hypothetical protein MiSe_93750 [Microseira wollei NIES-4236]